jgi:hypothetical protein
MTLIQDRDVAIAKLGIKGHKLGPSVGNKRPQLG